MFKDWEEGNTGGSRSASFAYAVDDLRVIADNEEGKREDRFLNLIRGWREKLLSREHGGRYFVTAVERRRTIWSRDESTSKRDGERNKERGMEKERGRAVHLSRRERRRDRLYAPFRSTGPVFVQVSQSDTVLAEYFKGRHLLLTSLDLFSLSYLQNNLLEWYLFLKPPNCFRSPEPTGYSVTQLRIVYGCSN